MDCAAPDVGADDALGIWRIDDADNSFYTQPFRIKYARQDIYLSVMVSFNILNTELEVWNLNMSLFSFLNKLIAALSEYLFFSFKGPAASAVILKYELIYAPTLENG